MIGVLIWMPGALGVRRANGTSTFNAPDPNLEVFCL